MARAVIPAQWNFGARDAGLQKEQDRAASGFKKIGESVVEASKQVFTLATSYLNLTTEIEQQRFEGARSARLMLMNLGKSGDELNKMAAQASSLQIQYKFSTNEAADAVWGFGKAQKALAAAGIKSAAELGMMGHAYGVNTKDLAQNLSQIQVLLKGNAQDTGEILAQFYESGKAAEDVGGFISSLTKNVGNLQARVALAAKNDPKRMKEIMMGTARLGATIHKTLQLSGDSSLQMAESISEAMTGAQRNFKAMFAGTETELGPWLTSIGIAHKDVNKAFKSMAQSPEEFMAGLGDMVQQLKKTHKDTALNMNLIRGQIEHVFGPEQADKMFNFLKMASDETIKGLHANAKEAGKTVKGMDKHLKKAKKIDIGKQIAKDFGKVRTAAEALDLKVKLFQESLRTSGEPADKFAKDVGSKLDFVKGKLDDMAKASRFGKWLKDTIADTSKFGMVLGLIPNGPLRQWGGALAALAPNLAKTSEQILMMGSAAKNLGLFKPLGFLFKGFGNVLMWLVKAPFRFLLASWEVITTAFTTVISFVAPVLMAAVEGIGAVFAAITSPIGLVIAAIAAVVAAVGGLIYWFVKLRKSGMTTREALTHMWDETVQFFKNIPKYAKSIWEWFTHLGDHIADFFKGIPDRIKGMFGSIGGVLGKLFGSDDTVAKQAAAEGNRATPAMPAMPDLPTSPMGGRAVRARAAPDRAIPGKEEVTKAVHDPSWYSGDFRELFTSMIGDLIDAVNALKGAGPGAPTGRGRAMPGRKGGVSQSLGGAENGIAVTSTGQPVGQH